MRCRVRRLARLPGRIGPGARFGLLVAALLVEAARPALADEALARRLVTLRSLVPGSAAAAAPPSDRGAGEEDCAHGAWWDDGGFAERARTRQAIRDASLRFAVDADLIRSVIRHESAGDIRAVSHKGAMGLMQLMPATAERMGVVCAFDPRQNVLGGTRYLRRMRDRLGTWERAVAAYHAGPGRVERNRLPAETRRYVARVMGSWR